MIEYSFVFVSLVTCPSESYLETETVSPFSGIFMITSAFVVVPGILICSLTSKEFFSCEKNEVGFCLSTILFFPGYSCTPLKTCCKTLTVKPFMFPTSKSVGVVVSPVPLILSTSGTAPLNVYLILPDAAEPSYFVCKFDIS